MHLAVQLGRQGLVGRKDQGRSLHGLDHIGHGEGLAGTGHTQQGLVGQPVLQALDQGRDSLRLVTGRTVIPISAGIVHSQAMIRRLTLSMIGRVFISTIMLAGNNHLEQTHACEPGTTC